MLDRKSALVSALLKEFKCDIFEHAMYSTDCARSDYHLFLHIKKFLTGHRLRCDQHTNHILQDSQEGRLGGELFRRKHTKAGPTI